MIVQPLHFYFLNENREQRRKQTKIKAEQYNFNKNETLILNFQPFYWFEQLN